MDGHVLPCGIESSFRLLDPGINLNSPSFSVVRGSGSKKKVAKINSISQISNNPINLSEGVEVPLLYPWLQPGSLRRSW